jgi:hypothetical protein
MSQTRSIGMDTRRHIQREISKIQRSVDKGLLLLKETSEGMTVFHWKKNIRYRRSKPKLRLRGVALSSPPARAVINIVLRQ